MTDETNIIEKVETEYPFLKRELFLRSVHDYIIQDPGAAAYIGQAVERGLGKALGLANERAADMECALSMSFWE